MRSEYHTPDDLVAYLKGLLTEDETAALEARVAADQDLAIELERTRTVLQITAAASDEAVTGRVNGYLERAIAGRASDIHLDLVRDGAVVRLRIDGVLHVVDRLTVDEGRACMARLKTLGGLPPADFQRPADGRIPLRLEGRDYDLRVSYAPGLHGGRLCARILSRGDALPAWDAVGLLPAEDAALRRMIRMPHGLIVVCGPTGCGKTTLLYMLMQQIASPEINCLSVEDPVELAMDWVAQSRVNVAAGQTFASLVRTFMRQDPDAILVGEIRDLETLQITCQAALTGHLVMTTLHTQHAIGAVRRMVDLGLEPFLLANVLVGIVGMRLVRCICPHCRAEVEPSSTAAMHFGLEPGSYAATAGQGCEHCHGTGYRGRRGLYEVIEVSKALSQAIAERAMRLRELAFSGELPDFRGHAAQLIREGVTTPEECARVLDQAW